MMESPALLCRQHRALGLLVSDQSVVAPRRRPAIGPFELLQLGRIGGRLGARQVSGPQTRGERIGDGAGDVVYAGGGVDHDAALRIGGGNFEKAGAHALVEIDRQ